MEPIVIKPPSTGAAAASPTDSLLEDVKRVFLLIEDERHLSALSLYHSVRERLDPHIELNGHAKRRISNPFKRGKKGKEKIKDEEKVRELLHLKHKELDELEVGPC